MFGASMSECKAMKDARRQAGIEEFALIDSLINQWHGSSRVH